MGLVLFYILLLIQTNLGKVAGPDDIIPEILRNIGRVAKQTLFKHFNLVWSLHIPDEWRKAEVISILKKVKNTIEPENFRPISLTSVVSKLYERIVVNRLMITIENLIPDRQSNFMKHRNTFEQVARLAQHINGRFKSNAMYAGGLYRL